MRPLYAGRFSDLAPGEFVQVECAWHAEMLTAQMLATAGVRPEAKVIDLSAAAAVPGVRREGAGGDVDQVGLMRCDSNAAHFI